MFVAKLNRSCRQFSYEGYLERIQPQTVLVMLTMARFFPDSPCRPCTPPQTQHPPQDSYLKNWYICSSWWTYTDWAPHYYTKSIVYIGLLSWCCVFYGPWQMYLPIHHCSTHVTMCVLLWYSKEELHCPPILVLCLFIPPSPQPLANTEPSTASLVLPFPECLIDSYSMQSLQIDFFHFIMWI